MHDVFHVSLLRIHEPKNDCLFSGRLDHQVLELEDPENEWVIDRIISHSGSGTGAVFEASWSLGNRSWIPYQSISHLNALNVYLEASGVESIGDLPIGSGSPSDNPQLFAGCVDLSIHGLFNELWKSLKEVDTHLPAPHPSPPHRRHRRRSTHPQNTNLSPPHPISCIYPPLHCHPIPLHQGNPHRRHAYPVEDPPASVHHHSQRRGPTHPNRRHSQDQMVLPLPGPSVLPV